MLGGRIRQRARQKKFGPLHISPVRLDKPQEMERLEIIGIAFYQFTIQLSRLLEGALLVQGVRGSQFLLIVDTRHVKLNSKSGILGGLIAERPRPKKK